MGLCAVLFLMLKLYSIFREIMLDIYFAVNNFIICIIYSSILIFVDQILRKKKVDP